MSSSSWASRIEKLKLEKKETEDTEYSLKCELIGMDFFVSEHVIPNHCKIYDKSKLVKFNLKGIKKSDLIIKEIFRRKHDSSNIVKTNIDHIKKQMFAVLNILSFHPSQNKQEDDIYKNALLGVTGTFFTALDDHPIFWDVLNEKFRKHFRNLIFHFGYVFSKRISVESLKLVISHFYEHCRLELSHHYKFPAIAIDEKEKFKAEDNKIKTVIISYCLEVSSAFYEWKNSILPEIGKHRSAMSDMMRFFDQFPTLFCTGRFPEQTSLAVRGSAVGLHAARISGAVTSLLREKTWDRPMAKMFKEEKIRALALEHGQKAWLQKEYDALVKLGNAFRHNRITYSRLIEQIRSIPSICVAPLTTKPSTQLLMAMLDKKKIDFQEQPLPGNDDAFVALSTTRNEINKLFLGCIFAKVNRHEYLLPEIKESLAEAHAVLWQTEKSRQVLTEKNNVQSQLDKIVQEANARLQKEEKDYAPKEMNDLIQYLSKAPHAHDPKSQETVQKIMQKCLELFRVDSKLDEVCKYEVFKNYIDLGLAASARLGYRSALLLAHCKKYNGYLFRRTGGPQSTLLEVMEKVETENPQGTLYLLHTGRFTHFSLLKKMDTADHKKNAPENSMDANANAKADTNQNASALTSK